MNEKIKKQWTPDYINALKELAPKHTDKQIAQIMSNKFDTEFTMVSIRRKRNKLGIKKFGGKKLGIKYNIKEDSENV